MAFTSLAKPGNFLKIAAPVSKVAFAAFIILLLVGLPLSLYFSPPDYQQSQAVRMMYVHVPAAWMAMLIYSAMAINSAIFLIWRHTLADIAARASAPIGACFTLICLITGSIWGKPMWGTWWVWDARLTSVLVLFFLYLGYIMLCDSLDYTDRARKSCAILALIGFINLPIIKFSVEWWNTLHQPASLLRAQGPAIHDPLMLSALFTMGAAFLCLYISLLSKKMQTELLRMRLRRLGQ